MRLLLPLLLVLSGCTAELKEQLNDTEAQLVGLRAELEQTQTENDRLRVRIADLERDLANYRMADAADLDPTQELWTKIDTTMGDLLCELQPARAPGTVSNFVQLVESTKEWERPGDGKKVLHPLYPGTIFHRVIPEFMIQGGDPSGDGTGGTGYVLEDEFHPDLRHVAGAISMAKGSKGHNGSQFFVTEVATPHLDDVHNVFGVCEPLSLVKDIARVPVDGEKPIEDVVIEEVTIHRGSKPR